MHFDRLFHALVISGAVLVAGCDDEDGSEEGDDGAGPGSASDPDSAGGSESGGASGHDDAATTGGIPDPSGSASMSASGADTVAEGGEPGSSGDASASEGGSEGEPHATTAVDTSPPEGCSDPADAHDPCGCPCCWALDCINEDAVCCAGFSELCTPT